MVVAACGSGEAAETTTKAVRVKPEATVTYNGEDCVYVGPDMMTSGLVEFTYVNETEREVILGWWLLGDDVEYDDFAGGCVVTFDGGEANWTKDTCGEGEHFQKLTVFAL